MVEEKGRGFIEWKVTGNLLRQFKNANFGQAFSSPEFQTVDGSKWKIKFYPRGAYTPEDCVIYVMCVKLMKPRIGVNYMLAIPEVDWIDEGGSETFEYDGWMNGPTETFKAEKISNLNALTIKCIVEETMDVVDENTVFEWKVKKQLLSKYKHAKYEQYFISPRFKSMGAIWFLQIYPNGWKTEGTADIRIWCDSIESGAKEINFYYSVDIPAINYYHSENKYITQNECISCNSAFKLNDIQRESELIVAVQIWEQRSFDKLSEMRLMSYIHSEKIMKLQKESSTNDIDSLQNENRKLKQEIAHINNFKSEVTSIMQRNEGIAEEFKRLAMKDRKQQQEINKLHKQIKDLQNENSRIKEENYSMRSLLGTVAMHEIKTFAPNQETGIRHDTITKQKEFYDKLQTNENRLNNWKVDSRKIEKELKLEEKENVNWIMHHLLNRYTECKNLCNKQQNRMENVMLHYTELNKLKKKLKKERNQCNDLVNKTQQKCNDLNEKYEALSTKRIKAEKKWKNVLREMNEIIDEENKVNASKYSATHEHNIYNLELKQWNELYSKYSELMQKYQLFDTQTEENIQQLTQMFDNLWIQSMSNWFEWKPNDIVCWMKYLEKQDKNPLVLSKEFDFDLVLNEMIESKIRGSSLKNIDKSDLKIIGVSDFKDRQQIYHKINELIAKYPHFNQKENDSESTEGQTKKNNIPKEFICPLTKQIMMDPVKIFDNNTYEKQAIARYLKEYNKSPITGEECDDDSDHWILPNRKLKEKIIIYLSVNDIFNENVASHEDIQIEGSFTTETIETHLMNDAKRTIVSGI